MTLDLSVLNDEQVAAVTHGEGPLLVISAAGSGKTRCLTYRAAWLIEQGVSPNEVMLATFTRKAATEMTERVAMLVGDRAGEMHSGTLHSLFLRILRAENYPWREFDILDEYGQKRLVRDLLGKAAAADDLASILGQISLWKNELVDTRAACEEDAWTGRIFIEYEAEKRDRRVLDFDDMLTCAVDLFEARPETLDRYRRRTPWVLVDEAQDTSVAQWRLLELLSRMLGRPLSVTVGDGQPGQYVELPAETGETEPNPAPSNLTVVADWRQAIYSWRGARPEMVLDFATRFPGAAMVGLPRNYRSTPQIVEAANVLIRHAGRDLEDMVPTRAAGVDPYVVIAEDADLEASNVVGEVQVRLADGAKPGDFAVLYRCNAYSRALEEAFASARIPYVVVGSTGFFGRKEVADLVAYLTFVHDPDNEEALRRIVNRPTRFLGRAYCDGVVAYAKVRNLPLGESLVVQGGVRQRSNASDFHADLAQLADLLVAGGVRAGIQFVRGPMGYDAWLLREEGSGATDENRLENLDELANVADRYGSLESFLAYVDMQRAKSKSKDTADRVQLMTIHRSKGLEWPTVFAVGFAEGLIPHKRSTSPAELEEERRLAYVALTRARDELFVSTPLMWQGRSLVPSRFVYEAALIPNEIAKAMA